MTFAMEQSKLIHPNQGRKQWCNLLYLIGSLRVWLEFYQVCRVSQISKGWVAK